MSRRGALNRLRHTLGTGLLSVLLLAGCKKWSRSGRRRPPSDIGTYPSDGSDFEPGGYGDCACGSDSAGGDDGSNFDDAGGSWDSGGLDDGYEDDFGDFQDGDYY